MGKLSIWVRISSLHWTQTHLCSDELPVLCFPALFFFAGTAGEGRRPRRGQHFALLSGGEMLNQAVSDPKIFQGDKSQEQLGTCYESGENKEITELLAMVLVLPQPNSCQQLWASGWRRVFKLKWLWSDWALFCVSEPLHHFDESCNSEFYHTAITTKKEMVTLKYHSIWDGSHVSVAMSFNLTGQAPSARYSMGLHTSAAIRKAFKTQHYTNRTENTNKKPFGLRSIHAMEAYTREEFVIHLYLIYTSSPLSRGHDVRRDPGHGPSPLPCFSLLTSGCLEAVDGKTST